MVALPVSFYMIMVYGLILTVTLFSDQFNVLFHPVSANHKDISSGQMVPCYYRVLYPASNPKMI